MPRTGKSAGGRILDFFRGQSLEIAELVLGMAMDLVKERVTKSVDAKKRAEGLKPVARKRRKPKAAKPAASAQPLFSTPVTRVVKRKQK